MTIAVAFALVLTTFAAAASPEEPSSQSANLVARMRAFAESRRAGEQIDALTAPYQRTANRVAPAVVWISVKTLDRKPQGQGETTAPQGVTGSGFVVDAEKGLVVTNAHVVENIGRNGWRLDKDNAGVFHPVEVVRSRVTVQFQDEKAFDADVVDYNEREDLALIRLDPSSAGHPLTALELGDDKSLKVGSPVIAIGAPLGMNDTVTFGRVSKRRQKFVGHDDVIQHDAAVNPGNSGGPLVDLEGRVVGVNTWITSPTRQFQGLAYAIPVSLVKAMLERFAKDERVRDTALGLVIEPFHLGGVRVVAVKPGSPAAQSQALFSGDVIIAIDGRQVYSTDRPAGDEEDSRVNNFLMVTRAHKPGDVVRLTVLRGGLLNPTQEQIDITAY